MWKCTPETALQLESITLEPIINIKGGISNILTVQGCFMWEGQFRDYWWLSQIEYNDSSNQIKFQDEDGSLYIGTIDKNKEKITGMVYSKENDKLVPEDKLDFVRAPDVNEKRLFTPVTPKSDGSIQYSYQIPEKIKDDLQTESILKFVRDTSLFYELMGQIINQEYGRLESFLIIKDQKLVLEEYFYNYDRTQLHNIFSCTKSVVSLLAGIAFGQNENLNVETPIFDIFPQLDELKNRENQDITLKHVLTMTAGFEKSDTYKSVTHQNVVQNILSLSLESEPGEKFSYNSECPYLLGGMIHSLSGKPVDEFAKEKLFNPLGITNFNWKKENNTPHCESELYMLPRDMAKIGLLVSSNGMWEGQQIVSEQWIQESIKPHVKESDFFNYGFQWWHRSQENKSWWKESDEESKEHDMFLALGYGGQYIFVINDLNLIVVMTSSDYNEGNGMAFKKIPMVIEDIVPLFEKE